MMKFLFPVLLFCLSFSVSAEKSGAAQSSDGATLPGGKGAKPNIILLVSDDQGYGDLGRHGHPFLKTPHMDRLHDESVRMVDFSVSPTCAPTRAALMTGMQEFNSGVTYTIAARRRMNREIQTLPQLLRDSGYATGLFGKWHLGHVEGYRPHERGFDVGLMVPEDKQNSHYDPTLLRNAEPVETEGYRTDIFFDAAMEWIEEKKEQAFFCYLPTYNAHGPLVVPERYAAPYKEWVDDEKTANYFGMLANLDENIGRLLARLESLGLDDNTLIVFLNDNGGTFGVDTYNAGMRGVKGTVWRGGTRAFCFWSWPTQWDARDEKVLSGHIDILPTLGALAGARFPVEVADKIEGVSLADRLSDPDAHWTDRKLFQHVSRWTDGFADRHQYVNASVRWKSWHLINQGIVDDCQGECRVYRKSINGEPLLYTKHADVHYKLSASKDWELYDLSTDPGEKVDLAQERPEIVKGLSVAYDAWWKKARPLMINEK